jgi:hypothetical protein
VARDGPAGETAPNKMDQNTPLSITDRKKYLEEKSSVPAVKSVKVEYASSFSIKPLIDFFNRAFRRDTLTQDTHIKENTIKKECVADYSEYDPSNASLIPNQTNREEIPTPDSFRNSSSSVSFVSCCSRFDSTGSVSSYYSLEEISCSSELGDEVFDLEAEHQIINDGQYDPTDNENSDIEELRLYHFEITSKLEDEEVKLHHEDENNSEKSDFTANKLNIQELRSDQQFLFGPEETPNNSLHQADINNDKDKHETMNFKSDIENEDQSDSKYETNDEVTINNDASIDETANPKNEVQDEEISLTEPSSLDQLQQKNNKQENLQKIVLEEVFPVARNNDVQEVLDGQQYSFGNEKSKAEETARIVIRKHELENDAQHCIKLSNLGEAQDNKNISEGKDKIMKVNAFDVEEHMEIEDHIVEQKSEISDSCQQDALEYLSHVRNAKHAKPTNIIGNSPEMQLEFHQDITNSNQGLSVSEIEVECVGLDKDNLYELVSKVTDKSFLDDEDKMSSLDNNNAHRNERTPNVLADNNYEMTIPMQSKENTNQVENKDAQTSPGTKNKDDSLLTLYEINMTAQDPINLSSSQTENPCSHLTMIDIAKKEGDVDVDADKESQSNGGTLKALTCKDSNGPGCLDTTRNKTTRDSGYFVQEDGNKLKIGKHASSEASEGECTSDISIEEPESITTLTSFSKDQKVKTPEENSANQEMRVTRGTLSDNEGEKTKIDSTPQKMLCIENVEMCKNIQDNATSVIEKHGSKEVTRVECSITTENSPQPTGTHTLSNKQFMCNKTALIDRHSTAAILQVEPVSKISSSTQHITRVADANNPTIKGPKQLSKENTNQELLNKIVIKDELAVLNSDINYLGNNAGEYAVTDVIDTKDTNLYNAGCFIREERYLNDQHVFVEAAPKEEQPGLSANQVNPIFKEQEPNALDSNKLEQLIRDSSLCELPREESDCLLASTSYITNEKTKLILSPLSQHDSALMKERVISNIDSDLQIRPVKNNSEISKHLTNEMLSSKNGGEITKSPKPETNKLSLPEENIALYNTVLPDIIKSTSEGNTLGDGKDCLLGSDTINETILGEVGKERQQSKTITLDGNGFGENIFKDDEISDSNKDTYSCISIYDGYNSTTSEETSDRLEINCDKAIQEEVMSEGNNKNPVSDIVSVSSKDSEASTMIVSCFGQNEANDAKTNDKKLMNESNSKDVMPDVVKDQFQECHNNTIKQRDIETTVEGYLCSEERTKSELVSEDNIQTDIVNVRKFACCEKMDGNLSFDMEGATSLEHDPQSNCKSDTNYNTPDLKSWSDCTSVCSTSSSTQDPEGNSRKRLAKTVDMSRGRRDTSFDKRPWNYGAWCDYDSLSSSSLMEEPSEGGCMRECSEKTENSPATRRATSYEFGRQPWNFGTRRSCRSAVNSTPIQQFSDTEECSARRDSSELTRRATVTEFDRKPWNYGAWRDRRSVASFTQLTRSSDSEGNFQRHSTERRSSSMVSRRAPVAEVGRKPWNYGAGVAGGSKYKKLMKYFEKKRSVI